MASSRTIVVAGAGIGGLTTALALAERDFRVVLFDQAERLEEVGAGIQLSPNASRLLIGLGLKDRLAPLVIAPESVCIHRARSGRELARLPLGPSAEAFYGAPYWIIHRGDLQAALLDRARCNPDIEIVLGAKVDDFAVHPNGITVAYARRGTPGDATGIALIGADGLWSSVRRCLGDRAPPRPAGRTAWRAVIPATAVPSEWRAPLVHLWLGPDSHLVHYPIRGGTAINVVAIAGDRFEGRGWSTAAERDEVLARFGGSDWAQPAREILALPPRWLKWALYDREPLGCWSRGPVTLLGDAAHPMLPFLAQGAAMAIEDAMVLADLLARMPADPAGAMRAYETARRPRTSQVQRGARANDRRYHLSAPASWVRDFGLSVVLGGEVLLHRYDWIYEWRP